jgi:periplasmic protein TonB
MKFVLKNLKYPEMAKRMGIEGKVWVTFIVEKDGSISTIKITRGVNADLDREAIRIVSLFPKWSPGMQNGRTVKSQFVIPIPFKLDR